MFLIFNCLWFCKRKQLRINVLFQPPVVCRRCFIYFICVCFRIVLSNTHCVVVFVLVVLVMCFVYPMLPISLDCFCFLCLRLVSCVPNVANFSGLFLFSLSSSCVPYVVSFSGLFLFCLSSSCLLCTQCCQFLWIVQSGLPLRYSLTFRNKCSVSEFVILTRWIYFINYIHLSTESISKSTVITK